MIDGKKVTKYICHGSSKYVKINLLKETKKHREKLEKGLEKLFRLIPEKPRKLRKEVLKSLQSGSWSKELEKKEFKYRKKLARDFLNL